MDASEYDRCTREYNLTVLHEFHFEWWNAVVIYYNNTLLGGITITRKDNLR